MCNLSDLIEERAIERGLEQGIRQGIEQGIERGIERGIEQGKLEAFYSLVRDGLLSSEEAAKRAGMSVEEFQSAMTEAGY